MSHLNSVTHQFVEFIPSILEERIIYVSVAYTTAVHKCCCGCGNKVVTPITPTDWKLIFDGKTISLHPSIGNWSFPCRSHYWIQNNEIQWAGDWSQEQVNAGRKREQVVTQRYYDAASITATEKQTIKEINKSKYSFWLTIKQWWLNRTKKPR